MPPVSLLLPKCCHLARLRQQHAMNWLTSDHGPATLCRERYRAVQHLRVCYPDMLGDLADGHPLRVFAARQIIHALLKKQLDDLAYSVSDTGDSLVARGEAVIGTVKKATDTLIEQTETRPLTTLAAVAGIGSWQACFIVGTSLGPPFD
jgi:hypothetical protein